MHAYLARRTGVAAAEQALDVASEALAAPKPPVTPTTRTRERSRTTSRWAPPTSTARIGAVLADLGLPERVLDLEMPALSGGQAARASLAAILLARFDVFLLDEPTNDLDFVGLDRLERFLHEDLAGGAVIVSHDRAFLDRTVTSVLELDEHAHTATEYTGGWAAYLAEQATARRHAEEDYAKYVSQRDTLSARAAEQRQWSVQGVAKVAKSGETDKFIRHFRRNSSEHVAAKAKITDRALERLEANAVEKPWESWDLRMEIPAAPRGGTVVVRLTGAIVERGAVHARADRPADQLRRAGRAARRERQRQDVTARRRARPAPARRRATRTSGAAWSSASSTRPAARSRAPTRSSPASRPRAVCCRTRRGRCSRSSASAPIT